MYLHQKFPRSVLFVALTTTTSFSPAETGESRPDWESILEEADAISEWAADPLADLDQELGLLPLQQEDLFYSASIATGAGYSSNFLKRKIPFSSPYLSVEADASISWLGDHSTATGMLFVEGTFYQEGTNTSDEYLLFARGNWTASGNRFEYGIEGEVFYGDQIYDASLVSSPTPVGEPLRQWRPQAGVFADWYVTAQDRLRLGLSTLRVEFDVPEEDYWEPIVLSEWEHLWSKTILSQTRLEFSRQLFDDKQGRNADASDLQPGQTLRVNRLSLEQEVSYKPTQWNWLDLRLNLGLTWEHDRVGDYDSLRQSWASFNTRMAWKWGQVRLNARWMEIRYDDRQSGYFEQTPLLQTHRALKVELRKPLPWDLTLTLRGEWIHFDSRSSDESYHERRAEALLSWSY